MERNYEQTIGWIQESMSESAVTGFEDNEIEDLRVLIRLAVDFHHHTNSIPPWPHFPDDPAHDMMYKLDSILFNVDSFLRVMHAYGVLTQSVATAIDWNALKVGTLKTEFESVYTSFLAATNFETKCRLLLDLTKLQIVFAGAWYDCSS